MQFFCVQPPKTNGWNLKKCPLGKGKTWTQTQTMNFLGSSRWFSGGVPPKNASPSKNELRSTLVQKPARWWQLKYVYVYPDPWGIDANFKGCFSTPLEHTPKPLPTGYNGNSLHSWPTRLPGVGCSRGVLNFSWKSASYFVKWVGKKN